MEPGGSIAQLFTLFTLHTLRTLLTLFKQLWSKRLLCLHIMWSGLYLLDNYDYESTCSANKACSKTRDQGANFAKRM